MSKRAFGAHDPLQDARRVRTAQLLSDPGGNNGLDGRYLYQVEAGDYRSGPLDIKADHASALRVLTTGDTAVVTVDTLAKTLTTTNNTAADYGSVALGGGSNIANASGSSIFGGVHNTVGRDGVTLCDIFGGEHNLIHENGNTSAILSGLYNTLTSGYSIILGGMHNLVRGDYSIASGTYSTVEVDYEGVFIFGDRSALSAFNAIASNEVAFRAQGGLRHAYDNTHYWTAQIASDGAVTLDGIGAGAKFTFGKVIGSTVATDTAPFTIASTTAVANLNADLLDGNHAAAFALAGSGGITQLTGDVTAGPGSGSQAATIAAKAVTLAKMDDMATASLIYRKTAGTGAPEVNTLATLKTDLGSMPPSAHDIITGHIYTGGAALDVFGLSAANTIARLTPSSDVSAGASAILCSNAGDLKLHNLSALESIFSNPAGGGFTFSSVQPIDAGARKWNFNIGSTANPGDATRTDVTYNWGFNNAQNGGPEDTTDDCLYWQMESYYSPTAASKVFEYHLNYYGPAGTPSFRPVQITVYRAADTTANGPYHTEQSWLFDKINFLARDGGWQGFALELGANVAASQWIQYIPLMLRYSGAGLLMQDIAGNNEIVLNSTARSITFGSGAASIDSVGANSLTFNGWNYYQIGSALSIYAGAYATYLFDCYYDFNIGSAKHYKVNYVDVVGARRTGWTAQTATASRADLGAAPTVLALASFCRALYDDLAAHGLIGA